MMRPGAAWPEGPCRGSLFARRPHSEFDGSHYDARLGAADSPPFLSNGGDTTVKSGTGGRFNLWPTLCATLRGPPPRMRGIRISLARSGSSYAVHLLRILDRTSSLKDRENARSLPS